MRIDTHQNFWRIDRGDYGWLAAKDHPKIAGDFRPADPVPFLRAAPTVAKALSKHLASTGREAIFAGTAAKFYDIT